MDEGNLYVQQEAGGCYMHDGSNETWKFLSMCNKKIIKPLKFCIMRTWLIISITCFSCYYSPLPIPILHLCLLCFFNRFCKVASIHLTNTMNAGFLHTGHSKIWCWFRKSGFYSKNPSRQWLCLPLCLCSIFAWCGLINRWHFSCDQEMEEKPCLQATITYWAEH